MEQESRKGYWLGKKFSATHRENIRKAQVLKGDDVNKRISSKVKKLWENSEYRQHMIDAHKGKTRSPESLKKFREKMIGRKSPLSGRKLTDEHKKNISIGLMGKPSHWKGKKMSLEHREKMRQGMIKTLNKKYGNKRIGRENKLLRESLQYREWRKSVFERDNYMCVWCGDNTSGNLNADHIKPFAFFPDLRFELSNGRTLCVSCHRKTDTYKMGRANKHLYE